MSENTKDEITIKTLKAKITISELKARARRQIKGNLGKLFFVSMVTSLLAGGIVAPSCGMMVLSFLLISPALAMSVNKIYLTLAKGEGVHIEKLLEGFDDWWLSFKVQFLSGFFSFLWGLLLIVPGIVKYYAYAMASFIVAEDPTVSAREALALSQKLMKGYKRRLFLLDLSFLGWWLLNILSFGVASIYTSPYMSAARTNFYLVVKQAYEVDQQMMKEAKEEAEAAKASEAAKAAEEATKDSSVGEEETQEPCKEQSLEDTSPKEPSSKAQSPAPEAEAEV